MEYVSWEVLVDVISVRDVWTRFPTESRPDTAGGTGHGATPAGDAAEGTGWLGAGQGGAPAVSSYPVCNTAALALTPCGEPAWPGGEQGHCHPQGKLQILQRTFLARLHLSRCLQSASVCF